MIEFLNCFSFALYWMSCTTLLVGICADTILSASQSLLATFHVTLGQVIRERIGSCFNQPIKLFGSFLLLNAFGEYGMTGAVLGGLAAAAISLIFAITVIPASSKKLPI